MQMPSVNTVTRAAIGAVAALVAVIPLYYVIGFIAWVLTAIVAIIAAVGVGHLAATRGYDKLTDGAAALVNLVRGRKTVAAA